MKKKLYQLFRILIGKKTLPLEDESHNNEVLKENIKYKEVKTSYGSILYFCKNENEVPVDLDIKHNITTKNKKKHYIDHALLTSIAPGKEAVAEIYMCCVPEEHKDSYVTIEVSESIEDNYNDKIKLSHKDTGKNIELKIKNESNKKLDTLSIIVLYYKKKEIIDTYHYEEKYINENEEFTLDIEYPTNEEEKQISFDKYKVILNQASKADWFK